MINFPLESDVRIQIDARLNNLGWVLAGNGKNVFLEQPKTEIEKRKLQGKRPDYVLYERNKDNPLIVIETKKRGENIDKALEQGLFYAETLEAPIVFATDGIYYKSLYTRTHKPLILNGEEVDELIREFLAIQFLQIGSNELVTIPKNVLVSRQDLISIFDDANNILRVVGLRAGIERFSEFANILFLKLLSEVDNLRDNPEIDWKHKWDFIKTKPHDEILDYINGIVLPKISTYYHDDRIFSPLQINDGRVLKRIIDKLDPLELTNINSDIKGDAFEYFLRATSATGNDLGEYFTPRHIVKMMVKLVNPQIGEKIYDPFCGTGGMLIESFRHIYNTMPRNPTTLNILQKDTIFGNEITNTARITKMNMILTGDGHSNIQMKNSLEHLAEVENKFDVVLTNMPYSQTTDWGHIYDLPTKNGDSICVQHCMKAINMASENGRIAIIVPEGFLFRKDLQKTREYLLRHCQIQSIISLPQGVFLPYTAVKTNVLYLTKVGQEPTRKSIWYFDVKNDGYTLDSNRRKLTGDNDIDTFLAFRNTEKQEKNEILNVGFQQIQLEELTENDYILSGNRYKKFFDYSKTKHELIRIGDLFKTSSGGTPLRSKPEYFENGTIAWLKSGEVKGYVYSAEESITELGLANSSAKIFPVNTVLVAMYGATAGQVGILKIESATNQAVCGIYPNPKVLPEFLYWILMSKTESFVQLSIGGAQPNLSQEIIKNIQIPVPSLEEQQSFVNELNSYKNILDSAKSIIEKYKPIIISNPDWERVELSEVCKFAGGTQPPKSTFVYEPRDGYIRLLQIRDYKSDDNAVYIPITEKHKTCTKDDVMIGRYGPPVFQILRGKAGAYNVALIKCIPDKTRITNDWLYYFLSSEPVQRHIIGLSERARQSGVSPSDLNKLKIPLPPLNVQNEFVKRIKEEEILIDSNKKLIHLFEAKIAEKIGQIWGD